MEEILGFLIMVAVLVFMICTPNTASEQENTENKLSEQDILNAGGDWHDVIEAENFGESSPAHEQYRNITGKE